MYDYDFALRLTSIDHQNITGGTMLKMSYSYLDNDLPGSIVETGIGGLSIATTTYAYDTRGRLISEQRIGGNPYHLEYDYDQGGNRLEKRDVLADTKVEYYYDYENPLYYDSHNNRLMYTRSYDTSGFIPFLLSSDYYYYTAAGNVSRIITKDETGGGGSSSASSAGSTSSSSLIEGGSTVSGEEESTLLEPQAAGPSGGGTAAATTSERYDDCRRKASD